jgi:hypothetical protein
MGKQDPDLLVNRSDWGDPWRLRPGPGSLRHVPIYCSAKSVFERRPRCEPERFAGSACLQCTPRLPVRLGGIPADLAIEFRQPGDKSYQVPDRNLPPDAEIDGLGPIIPFGGQKDSFRSVIHV